MAAQGYPSPLANNVALRKRLSAVRQELGMEQGPQGLMRAIQPQGAPAAPAAVTSPQADAVMGPPIMGLRPPPESLDGLHVPAQGSGEPFQHVPPPGMVENMQAMAEQYHKSLPAQGSTPAPSDANPAPIPPAPASANTNPIAQFFQVMKRLPNPHELAVLGAHEKLSAQLGRAPSQQEIQSYFKPAPPKEPTNAA